MKTVERKSKNKPKKDNVMTKIAVIPAAVLLLIAFSGCSANYGGGGSGSSTISMPMSEYDIAEEANKKVMKSGVKETILCEKCGEVKDSEKCCDPNAERCTKCGLIKDSPGCVQSHKQTTCPIIKGSKINKNRYVDYEGKRIYFCCPGCDREFLKDPQKYMKEFEEAGIVLEDAPKKGKQ